MWWHRRKIYETGHDCHFGSGKYREYCACQRNSCHGCIQRDLSPWHYGRRVKGTSKCKRCCDLRRTKPYRRRRTHWCKWGNLQRRLSGYVHWPWACKVSGSLWHLGRSSSSPEGLCVWYLSCRGKLEYEELRRGSDWIDPPSGRWQEGSFSSFRRCWQFCCGSSFDQSYRQAACLRACKSRPDEKRRVREWDRGI